MITKSINNNTQIIFASDKNKDLLTIASNLNYVKKDGTFYKNVYIDEHSSLHQNGIHLPAIKIISKSLTTYIVNNTYNHIYSNIPTLIDELNNYGLDVDIKINDIPITINGNNIYINNKKVSFNTGDDISDKKVNSFIYRMTSGNGHMIQPLLSKYYNILYHFKGKKQLITGYTELKQYLHILREPINGLFDNSVDNDYTLYMNSNNININITEVTNGTIHISMNIDGDLKKGTTKPIPYLVFNTQPIVLNNQKLPFVNIKYKDLIIFVSPMYLTNPSILKSLKGGVNLLS